MLRVWPEYGVPNDVNSEQTAEFAVRVSPYLKGDPGDAAAAFIHTQSVASDTWVVNHNKGFRPNAAVYSPGWLEVSAQVLHVSDNQLTVQFNTPQTGFVVC